MVVKLQYQSITRHEMKHLSVFPPSQEHGNTEWFPMRTTVVIFFFLIIYAVSQFSLTKVSLMCFLHRDLQTKCINFIQ